MHTDTRTHGYARTTHVALMPSHVPPQWKMQHAATGMPCANGPASCVSVPVRLVAAVPFGMHLASKSGCLSATPLSPGRTLVPAQYTFAPVGAVVPKGWMREQLEAQRWGLTGNEYPAPESNFDNAAWASRSTRCDL